MERETLFAKQAKTDAQAQILSNDYNVLTPIDLGETWLRETNNRAKCLPAPSLLHPAPERGRDHLGNLIRVTLPTDQGKNIP
jgi:hypothetical protein